MAPRDKGNEHVQTISKHDPHQSDSALQKQDNKWEIVWLIVIIMGYLHIAAVYGLYLFLTTCTWSTVIWCVVLKVNGNIGTAVGTHRLWSHNSFKATLPLKILLICLQSHCYQGPVYYWVRNHRLHHKFVDTDVDPQNSKRGFFFSHIGFLMMRPHKAVQEKRVVLDMRDIEADPVVMFQKKHYLIMMPFFCFVLPALVPWYFFGESFWVAWHTASIFRYIVNLNETLTINSFAHWLGTRPYDKSISPTNNRLGHYATLGEGWHNYHHVFPYDYRSSELYGDNLITKFIELCAKFGLAYNLKTASEEMIQRRKLRTGDASGLLCDHTDPEFKSVWGWGDTDLSLDEHDAAIRHNKLTDGYKNAEKLE